MHRQQVDISGLDVTIVQPTTPREVQTLWPDFLEISRNLPIPVHDRFERWIQEHPKVMIMFYIGPVPAAWILRELNQTGEAAEIQGCIRDDLTAQVHEKCDPLRPLDTKAVRRRIQLATTQVERKILDETFFVLGRKVVMIQFLEDNHSVRGFAWKWGFKATGKNTHNQHLVYVLGIADYIRKRERLFPGLPVPARASTPPTTTPG